MKNFAFVLSAVVALYVVFNLRAGVMPLATQNGDVNGDGALDISDAVHLLNGLFADGAPPVAIAHTGDFDSEMAASLAQISTTLSEISVTLAEDDPVPCEDVVDRWEFHNDRTVTDTCTGLMWALNQVLVHHSVIDSTQPNEDVGYDDWRLPTYSELIDVTRSKALAIFPNTAHVYATLDRYETTEGGETCTVYRGVRLYDSGPVVIDWCLRPEHSNNLGAFFVREPQ